MSVHLDTVLSRLQNVQRNGAGWKALCPAHADKNPSLSIRERGGKILLKCFAGCSLEAVCAALGIEMRELSEDGSAPRIAAEYSFTDEHGALLYQVVRYEPKDFKQRRPAGNEGWIWNLNGVRRVLYRLPELAAVEFVLICEGEKDCETARTLGLVATCNAGGARKWREEYSESLRGKRVAIIADADDPGRKHAQQVAQSLQAKAESAKVLELPGAKDLTEWVEYGGTREALLDLIRATAEWKLSAVPRSQTPQNAALWCAETMAEFLGADAPEVEPLLAPLLYPETVSEIFAPRGLGKSMLAQHYAVELAQSGKRVLYIDRDNPRRVMRERLRGWGAHDGLANLKIISREKCPPLTRADLWAQFPYSDFDVVFLDSFDALAEGVGEQDSAKPSRAIAPILNIARRENGPAVMLLGNCIKSAQHSRGSGVVEDRADIVFEVRDATGFHPTGGKPWVEELPAQGAGDWMSRSARRKLRQVFRLAFICTKFRMGEEPEPFVVEVDTTTEPWSLRDVTDEIDREGAGAREQRARAKDDALKAAIDTLVEEIARRTRLGEPEVMKTEAENFMVKQKFAGRNFTQALARAAIQSPTFEIGDLPGKGRPKTVRLAGVNCSDNRNEGVTEPAKTVGFEDVDFCCPHSEPTTEITPSELSEQEALTKSPISVVDSICTRPKKAMIEVEI